MALGKYSAFGTVDSVETRPRRMQASLFARSEPPPPPKGVNTIQEGSFLTLHYRLAGPDGSELLSTFGAKPATMTLGQGQLASAFEQRLLGLSEGSHQHFELPPGEAFGPRNPALLQRVSVGMLRGLGQPDAGEGGYAVGEVLQFPTPDGLGHYAGVVRAVAADSVLFDFNHPLAGQPVGFEVHVIGVM